MSNTATPTPPTGGGGSDGQVIGHLIGAFTGVFLTVLVDFGVPLSDAQQRDLLSLVVTGWALFAGTYAWLARARHPVMAATTPAAVRPAVPDRSDDTTTFPPVRPDQPTMREYPRATGTATVRQPLPPTWPPYNPVQGPVVDDRRHEPRQPENPETGP